MTRRETDSSRQPETEQKPGVMLASDMQPAANAVTVAATGPAAIAWLRETRRMGASIVMLRRAIEFAIENYGKTDGRIALRDALEATR